MPSSANTRALHSFPTRRSSDLKGTWMRVEYARFADDLVILVGGHPRQAWRTDRKSTRLNSSHLGISYAVFCKHPRSTLFPYTTLFRSQGDVDESGVRQVRR